MKITENQRKSLKISKNLLKSLKINVNPLELTKMYIKTYKSYANPVKFNPGGRRQRRQPVIKKNL